MRHAVKGTFRSMAHTTTSTVLIPVFYEYMSSVAHSCRNFSLFDEVYVIRFRARISLYVVKNEVLYCIAAAA